MKKNLNLVAAIISRKAHHDSIYDKMGAAFATVRYCPYDLLGPKEAAVQLHSPSKQLYTIALKLIISCLRHSPPTVCP